MKDSKNGSILHNSYEYNRGMKSVAKTLINRMKIASFQAFIVYIVLCFIILYLYVWLYRNSATVWQHRIKTKATKRIGIVQGEMCTRRINALLHRTIHMFTVLARDCWRRRQRRWCVKKVTWIVYMYIKFPLRCAIHSDGVRVYWRSKKELHRL